MLPWPRLLNVAETLLVEDIPPTARIGFRDQLHAEVPIWRRPAPEAVAPREFGPDDAPPWWDDDDVVARRQTLQAARGRGQAAPLTEGP